MDNLIVMPRPATPTSYRLPEGGSAAILFFTGVRYLRHVDEAALRPPVSKAPVAPRRRRSDKAKKITASRAEQIA